MRTDVPAVQVTFLATQVGVYPLKRGVDLVEGDLAGSDVRLICLDDDLWVSLIE
jgi:hypothetical protein